MLGDSRVTLMVIIVTSLFMSVVLADGIMVECDSAAQDRMDFGPLFDLDEDDDSDLGDVVSISDDDIFTPIDGNNALYLGFTHALKPYCR